MSGFYLVQRLESRSSVDASRGFDGFFSLDYMGSSEFEWGAVPKALRAMREQPVVVETADVQIGGNVYIIHFVGHAGVSAAAIGMESWAAGEGHRRPFYGKERTNFPEMLTGSASAYVRTDAWWDIEQNVAWAVAAESAHRLARAFTTQPAGVTA